MLQYGHIAAHLSSLGLQIINLTIRMPTLGDLSKKQLSVFFLKSNYLTKYPIACNLNI